MRPIVFAAVVLLCAAANAQPAFVIDPFGTGNYIGVVLNSDGTISPFTSFTIITTGPSNPYPQPAPALRQAVEPLRQLTITPADGKQLALLFNDVAGGIGSAQITSITQLDEVLATEGTKLGIKGKYPNLSGLLDKLFQAMVAKPGDAPRFLTDKDAEVVRAVAWALWRAG